MTPKNELGLVQMWWGDGKGKTTAALGMALRALGRGFKVHLIQFLKGGIRGVDAFEEYGELKALKRFENFSFERYGMPEWLIGKPTEGHIEAGRKALEATARALSSGKYDMVIVDECLYAVQFGVISAEDLITVVKGKAPKTECVLTGSHKRLPEIEEIADLVTEVRKIKHHFDRGIKARLGTEF
uniref:Cob(I)alamin adenosyltransferase n=1 Tax=uncultured Acetothermia bacterium TaxID=236499 RepID=H5SI09_9BACT|nr:cob(I)alamin adenosyltransferase [uncultured Acetothermia bacterium]